MLEYNYKIESLRSEATALKADLSGMKTKLKAERAEKERVTKQYKKAKEKLVLASSEMKISERRFDSCIRDKDKELSLLTSKYAVLKNTVNDRTRLAKLHVKTISATLTQL